MDDRQTQIREGAGLEDSRVNQEFIDFLNKWSTPVLLSLAVAMGAWWGLGQLQRKKIARIDQAFSELASATSGGNPSPASLKTIAAEYEGIRAVSEMALLTTSDLYLNAFLIGIEPGAETNRLTGLPVNDVDLLDEDRRQVYLEQAGQIAQQVLDLSSGVEGKELIEMQALCRLASVKEGLRDFDGAKSVYDQLVALATAKLYPSVAQFASQRIENLEILKTITPLPSDDAFAPLPGEENLMPPLTQEQILEMIESAQRTEEDGAENGSEAGIEETISDTIPDVDLPASPADEPEAP